MTDKSFERFYPAKFLRGLNVGYRSVPSLVLRERNPLTHTPKRIHRMAKPIKRFGRVSPVPAISRGGYRRIKIDIGLPVLVWSPNNPDFLCHQTL